jgi:hypothetical protein
MADIFTHLLQEVPPLDVPELLAYFVKQSGPFLDQLGVSRGTLLCITYMRFHCLCMLFGNIFSGNGNFSVSTF